MALKQTIDTEIKTAMLARDKDRLRALRSIKSLILLAESENREVELDEARGVDILTKAAKQRRDSIEIYEQQDRQDLLETELAELKVIEEFLPKQLSEEEVKVELEKIIAKIGATSAADLGKVMGASMGTLKGKADGKVISSVAKALLS